MNAGMIARVIFILICAALRHASDPIASNAHGAACRVVGDARPVLVQAFYAGGEPMSYAETLIYGPNDGKTEYQNGRTDRRGGFAFDPEKPGTWRVEVHDGMGHKAETTVEVPEGGIIPVETGKATSVSESGWSAGAVIKNILFGISLICNFFLVPYYWRKPRRFTNSNGHRADEG